MPNPINSTDTYTIAYVNAALIAVVPDGDTEALSADIRENSDMCRSRDLEPIEPMIHCGLILFTSIENAEDHGAEIVWSDAHTVSARLPFAA